jgi:hypothetical protein
MVVLFKYICCNSLHTRIGFGSSMGFIPDQVEYTMKLAGSKTKNMSERNYAFFPVQQNFMARKPFWIEWEWLCFTAKWAIVQVYHGNNKLHSMKSWRWYVEINQSFYWISNTQFWEKSRLSPGPQSSLVPPYKLSCLGPVQRSLAQNDYVSKH